MESINRNNFFRIYDSGKTSLPVTPRHELQRTSPAVIMVPGELYSVYMNTGYGVGGITLTGEGGSFGVGVSVQTVTFTTGSHSIMDFTGPDIPEGTYMMSIGGYPSNPVEVMRDANEANNHSAFVRFGHSKVIGDFYYPYITNPNYRQRLRLRMFAKETQPEVDKEVYVPSFGQMRSLRGSYKRYVTFETPDYSEEDHEAAAFMVIQDRILINDKNYIIKPDSMYMTTPAIDTPLSSGTFSLYDNDAFVKIRC